MIIKCKLNVLKVDKTKLFQGKSGTYLDITLLENRDGKDQFGNDFMVIQDIPKADREAGQRGAILGNAKFAGESGHPPRASQKPAAQPESEQPPQDDDVPF